MATLKEILGDAYREDMTVADIESAIAVMKLADLSSGEYVSKGKLSDYERRMKEAEKKYQDKLSDEEKKQAELEKQAERWKAIERENALYKYTAKLSKTITDEKVLTEIAGLYADGDFATAMDKHNEYLAKERTEMEKKIKAELLKTNPQPQPSGGGSGATTKEQFANMGVRERTQLYRENPELYKQLSES